LIIRRLARGMGHYQDNQSVMRPLRGGCEAVDWTIFSIFVEAIQ
jgi:hypothetical protein